MADFGNTFDPIVFKAEVDIPDLRIRAGDRIVLQHDCMWQLMHCRPVVDGEGFLAAFLRLQLAPMDGRRVTAEWLRDTLGASMEIALDQAVAGVQRDRGLLPPIDADAFLAAVGKRGRALKEPSRTTLLRRQKRRAR